MRVVCAGRRVSTAVAVGLVTVMVAATGWACGCFSPPEPLLELDELTAVNQQSEQIIFEVDKSAGEITAHVMITYNGEPEQFAWLVPAPAVPELSLSSTALFGFMNAMTEPEELFLEWDACPTSAYTCNTLAAQPCIEPENPRKPNSPGPSDDDLGEESDGETYTEPIDVSVLSQEVVGDYETIVFSAEEASVTVDWLVDNGFIVNETMAPFMQPYLDAGMVFVAAKLVPGADLDSIHPLKMTFPAERPMIPLMLTAVAAEPELTVTAWIYGDERYVPVAQPLVDLDSSSLTYVGERSNYPMALSRLIDEAGGAAFVTEFFGPPSRWSWVVAPSSGVAGLCCNQSASDGNPMPEQCTFENDGICQCPLSDWDEPDCGQPGGLTEAVNTAEELVRKYSRVTRLTTRLNPEEMTFDPEFDVIESVPSNGTKSIVQRHFLNRHSLSECVDQIIDKAAYESILVKDLCSTVYCGVGECAVTSNQKAGCICPAGYAVRRFTELDGLPSVTCVPDTGTVDLGIGLSLPDICDRVDCGRGVCVDIGGFAACQCDDSSVGVLGEDGFAPATCSLASTLTTAGDAGGRAYTLDLKNLDVCAPPPPVCDGKYQWLSKKNPQIPGLQCHEEPPETAFQMPPIPPCYGPKSEEEPDTEESREDGGEPESDASPPSTLATSTGGGCSASPADASSRFGVFAFAFVALFWCRRRRR